MIVCPIAMGVFSAGFFVLWQYIESPWLILGYIFALLTVCGVYFFVERRKNSQILGRFEQILQSGSADYIADEGLTPTERRLITRLCELETREAKIRENYRN
ncbi:MAG: hypothetical protein ACI4XJ_07745, partial [Eubacteriales bacterium]